MRLKNHTQLRVMVNISEESEKINCSLILYTICLPFYSLAFRGTEKKRNMEQCGLVSVGVWQEWQCGCMLTADI